MKEFDSLTAPQKAACLVLLRRVFDEITRLHMNGSEDRSTLDRLWARIKRIEIELRDGYLTSVDNFDK